MDFYSPASNIDSREEMHALLFGRIDIVAQGRPVILRKLTNNVCACWNGVTGGPIATCAYCQGEGYTFYETHETMYIAMGVAPVYKPGYLASGQYPQAGMGYDDPNRATGYCEASVYTDYSKYSAGNTKAFDKIYDVQVKPNGGIFYPITRIGKYKVLNLTPLHGDFGRVEFIELSLAKENF